MSIVLRLRSCDPRLYQIATLASLLAYGAIFLRFDIRFAQVVVLLGAALGTQWGCSRLWRLPAFDPKSAMISGLSLCLLLRTNALELAFACAVVTVASKFAIRCRGKHLFNPTNFGIVLFIALTGDVWVSPGQWGNVAFFGFLMACCGGLVVNRAARSDVTYAFIVFYVAMMTGRSLWLGEPMSIPIHRLQNGALLLFTFFMISDPKTTPDSRAGRVVFALLVAAGAWYIQFRLFRTNGLLWSLASCSVLVPLIDCVLPGRRYDWAARKQRSELMTPQFAFTRGPARRPARLEPAQPPSLLELARRQAPIESVAPGVPAGRRRPARGSALLSGLVLAAALAVSNETIAAFCGFYVAKADTKLFNRASRVVLVRDGDRTVLTMASDFKGDAKEFAVVIPVPTFIRKDQIHVASQAVIDHLDAYSAPRLVEYDDDDPCRRWLSEDSMAAAAPMAGGAMKSSRRERSLGVTVEATYTVGEYDIIILSAQQSTGLQTWLRENGYRIPAGADRVLGSYIRQNMRFFVARVNLTEQARLGFNYLRPLQVAYESPKFMLPIRLGTVNADGPQDLFIFALTKKGRVEPTNYRTVKLPSDVELPLFVKRDFADFYRAMFTDQVRREHMSTVFLEYAWDMGWCDPCAADPLSDDELRTLGVFWLDGEGGGRAGGMTKRPGGSAARDVFVTRLHARYDAVTFPEDLVFQETADRTNFQGRYVLRHPWTGQASCEAAREYRRELRDRQEREARTLASLTGWSIEDVRRRMDVPVGGPDPGAQSWWQRLWP